MSNKSWRPPKMIGGRPGIGYTTIFYAYNFFQKHRVTERLYLATAEPSHVHPYETRISARMSTIGYVSPILISAPHVAASPALPGSPKSEMFMSASLAPQRSSIAPLTGHVMVLHGAFNQGQYDRFLPAACGPIQAA